MGHGEICVKDRETIQSTQWGNISKICGNDKGPGVLTGKLFQK